MMRRTSINDSWRKWLPARLWRIPQRKTRRGINRFGTWSAVEWLEGRTLPVSVLPVNHAPTDLVLANGYVIENSPAGTLVGHFGTADPDVGERFSYSLIGGDADLFQVEGNRLLSHGDLDFETRDRYELLVRSTDFGGASIERSVTVRVMNADESHEVGGLELITRLHPDVPPSDSVDHEAFFRQVRLAGANVVFDSPAPNLVPGDTNGTYDIFLVSQNGDHERISVGNDGQQANEGSFAPTISRDSRFVTFVSNADNLVDGDTNGRTDAFVRDRQLGTTTRVSLDSTSKQFVNAGVNEVAISADGRFVAFVIYSDITPSVPKREGGLFVRDLTLGKTTRLIRVKDENSYPHTISISGDGRRIAYVVNQHGVDQVRVVNSQSKVSRLVSVSRFGAVRSQRSDEAMISESGRFVVFSSAAAGLVPGGRNQPEGVFVRDLQTNTTRRADDLAATGSYADSPSISADGRFVAYRSPSSGPAYFLRDLIAGTTQNVSVSLNGNDQGSSTRAIPVVSSDGRFVTFTHVASNLVPRDGNNDEDLFLRDTHTGTTELITRRDPGLPSITSMGTYGAYFSALTKDGSEVLFSSRSVDLVPGLPSTAGDPFRPLTFAHTLTSPFSGTSRVGLVEGEALISDTGQFVLFITYRRLAPDDTDGERDLYVLDRETGTYQRANLRDDEFPAGEAGGLIGNHSISGDGRFVVFSSSASRLVSGYANGELDIFIRDLRRGTTTRVDVATDGTAANGGSSSPSVSSDGRFVAFMSRADNLVPNDRNGQRDIFVRDVVLGNTTRVNVSSSGVEADRNSHSPIISGDGRFVVFMSEATNLVAGHRTSYSTYWHDRQTGTTQLVNVPHGNSDTWEYSYPNSLSDDGRFVVFSSDSDNLVPGDTNHKSDVFVRDMSLGITRRVSVGPHGEQANDDSGAGMISGDGSKLVFATNATNLTPNDFNRAYDLFAVDLATIPTATGYSVKAADSLVTENQAASLTFVLERDGALDQPTTVAFQVSGTALFGGDYDLSGAESFDGSSGTVRFAAGQRSVVIQVTPNDDDLAESVETVEIRLDEDVLAYSSENRATGYLDDDDLAEFLTTPPFDRVYVSETGSTAQLFVVLSARPASNVVLNIESSDTTEVKVLTKSLTFTSDNWNVPQAVTVRGVNDSRRDGDQDTVIFLRVNQSLSDQVFAARAFEAFAFVGTLDDDQRR